jgi:hypothetical protein
MHKRRNITLAAGLVTAALVGWACERYETPAALDVGTPSFDGEDHKEECPVKKFTGGGRIDPPNPAGGGIGVSTMIGKVTFGFVVMADDNCQPIRGQLQVNHHPSKTKFHAGTTSSGGSFDSFTSYPSREGGECGEWHGTIRVKHGNGPWHDDHTFGVQVCDNGEGKSPGTTARDTFWFRVDDVEGGTLTFGHGDTDRTRLTGGNIQAH